MKKFGLTLLIMNLLVLGACSKDPQTYTTNRTDLFVVDNEDIYSQANQILQADYVFAIDESASMDYNSGDPNIYSSKRAEFMAGLSSFTSTLRSSNIDYRIGVISGNVQKEQVSDLSSRSFYKNILVDSLMPDTTENSLIAQLQSIGQTLNANTNVMLEATHQVMTRQRSSFLREGAQLIYLFVSDTDDESINYLTNASTSDYAAKLIAQKGSATNIPAFVNARAIVTGMNSSCTPNPSYSESAGYRLAETAQKIENTNKTIAGLSADATLSSVSHCILKASTEFPTLLNTLARDVSKPTNLFKLQVTNVDPSSIKVYVDKHDGSGLVLQNTSSWVYLAGSNAIKFATAPAASSTIKLLYSQFYQLSAVPTELNSLSVGLNGSLLQLSNSYGWSYDSVNNRILFNGLSVPNGTRIEVSYK
jgi:hypothetical protein